MSDLPDDDELLERVAAGGEIADVDFASADLRLVLSAEPPAATTFLRCTFTDADASRARLAGVAFVDCQVDGVRFTGADLAATSWRGGSAARGRFLDADLGDAVFDGVDLANTTWRGAMLAGTSFTGCRMVGAHLEDARGLGTRFARCNLMLADLSGISLRGQTLDGLRLDDATLAGADLRDTVWTDSRLRGASLRAAELDGADLRGADLGDFLLEDLHQLSGATISADQAAGVLAQLGVVVDG